MGIQVNAEMRASRAKISLQEVHSLLEKEAVRCIFIQDNPTFDSLRTSLGLPPSQLASASQHAEHQLALKVASHLPPPTPHPYIAAPPIFIQCSSTANLTTKRCGKRSHPAIAQRCKLCCIPDLYLKSII